MPKFKSVVDSFIEFFTAEEKEFEYELLIPTEVEKKVQEAAPTLLLRAAEPITEPAAEPVTVPTAEPAAESSPVKAAEEIVEPSPVKGPLFEAEEALEESLKRLSFIESQAALAAQEVSILAEVNKVNSLIRKIAVEMGEQRLLPRQMEERRKAVAADSDDILEMFNDLGF